MIGSRLLSRYISANDVGESFREHTADDSAVVATIRNVTRHHEPRTDGVSVRNRGRERIQVIATERATREFSDSEPPREKSAPQDWSWLCD